MAIKLLTWLLPLLLLACAGQQATPLQLAAGGDSGFGGTGIIFYSSDDGEGGSGFGGTGIVGNIDAFGSIWVNGIEVDYDNDVRISSNLPGSELALKLGQTVVLETIDEASDAGRPLTREIRILYTMAGAVEVVEDQRIRLQGQWVTVPDKVQRDENLELRTGVFIALNAYRDDAGHWVASRLSANPGRGIIEPHSVKVEFSGRVRQLVVNERFRFIRPDWAKQRIAPSRIRQQFIPAGEWSRSAPGVDSRAPAAPERSNFRHAPLREHTRPIRMAPPRPAPR